MKNFKTLSKVLSFGLMLVTFVFSGCNNIVSSSGNEYSGECGSLSVSMADNSRAFYVDDIKSAKAVVTGFDSNGKRFERYSEVVPVVNGGASGVFVENIPVTKNAVVSVYAFNDEKGSAKLESVVIYAVTDICAGENSVAVNKSTSNNGLVYYELVKAGVNTNALTDGQMDALRNATPDHETISYSLVKAAEIAKDFNNGKGTLKASSEYRFVPATISVSPVGVNGYTIQVNDPASGIVEAGTAGFDMSVAPGSWTMFAIKDGVVKGKKSFSITEAASANAKVEFVEKSSVEGKIVLHVPASLGFGYAYYWNGDCGSTTWPGKAMAEDGDMYTLELEGTKTFVIFNDGTNKSQTKDLSVTEGEWNYIGGSAGTVDKDYSKVSENFEEVENITGEGKVVITFEGVEPPVSEGIVVHAKYTNVHIWNVNGKSGDLTEWPGATLVEEGNGWYVYSNDTIQSCNLKFNNNGGNESINLSIDQAGEYWFANGKFTEYNPEDTVPPVLVSFDSNKAGEVSGTVVFTVSATDDKNLGDAEIYIDDKKAGTVKLSGTSDTGTFEWDTSFVKNGSHKIVCTVYDASKNPSASETVTLTTKNANLPPIAVIAGSKRAALDSEVTYKATASYDQNGGSIKSYKWTVTGATIVSGENSAELKVKTPATDGSVYTVSLVVTDDEGAPSATVSMECSVAAVDPDWDFRDESIYFVMTTRFYDGDTSNNEYCWDEGGEYLAFGTGDCAWRGDFKGLAQKLDYIKALGFSAIWITPVVENASGIDYHGYHAYDFSKVDPRYESTGYTYQDFIDECHAKGIKVIQDIVLNHSGNFGERNIFHMFDKDTVPYENKDIPVPAGGKRSPFMKVAPDGNAYSKLMAGLSVAGGSDYDNEKGGIQYGARINAMKEDSIDTDFIYHHAKMIDWNSENCQLGQMAGDCVDLNTENPVVFNYLKDCYTKYIEMGVDAFRIDTVKHISRYTFNKEFIPAFMEAGGENFYIFGETCARYRGRWNEGVPALSPSFYTWKENKDFAWSQTDHTVNSASASAHFATYKSDFAHPAWADGIANHLLNGNNYHTPDWSMRSHLDQIDFPMHWAFSNAKDAFQTAVGTNDPDFNDATWNVVYVDSHDYAPDNAPEGQRYAKTDEWPRNMNLMFSFRGIPCLYYGSEVMFMAGAPIDPANTRTSLDKSGRAYFGDYLEGSVTASDYSEYTASGKVKETLSHPLAQHVTRLNKIRRSIAALRKGQYSTAGCSGSIAFKRRYTDENVDSFALVAIGGQATFSGVPAGEYIEVITGKTVSCSGSLTSDSIGQDNMRIYVLKTSTCEVDGKIGEDGEYLK